MQRPSEHGDADRRGDGDAFRTDHLQADLKGRSVRGGAFTMGAQGIKVAAQFATIVILARLLSPDVFGVFAVVMALINILELFKDLGLSSATVQREDINHRQVTTLYWLNGALGLGAGLLLAGAAPVLAWIYDRPILQEVTPVIALTLLLTGFAAQHLALLRRQMRFKTLACIQTGAELTGMAGAIASAYAGLGLWSLVVQRLTWGAVMVVGASLASGWRPSTPGRFSEVRSLVAFGGNATGAMVLGDVSNNLQQMLIGWHWGAAPLGLYERAWKLIQMPVRNVNVPLSTVALPMLSRLNGQPERYRRAYVAFIERVGMAMAPGAGLIVAAALPVTLLVLGPQWRDAAPVLSWLGISIAFMPVTYTLSWLYMSQDRTREMLRAAAVNVSVTAVVFFAALPFGIVAVAASLSLSGLLVRMPVLIWLAGRESPVGVGDFFDAMKTPLAGALAAGLAVHALQDTAEVAALAPWLSVALSVAVAYLAAVAVYGLLPRGRRALAASMELPRLIRARGARA